MPLRLRPAALHHNPAQYTSRRCSCQRARRPIGNDESAAAGGRQLTGQHAIEYDEAPLLVMLQGSVACRGLHSSACPNLFTETLVPDTITEHVQGTGRDP